MAKSSLPSELKRSVSSYAGHLTRLVKTYAPKHLQDNVRTTTKEVSPGVVRVTVIVKAPDAHAQEYGSGLRSQYGRKAKYPIAPKPGHKYLAFHWEMNTVGAVYLPDGRIRLKSVMHPGINRYKGRGYVRPAVKEWVKGIKESSTIPQAVKTAILGDIRKAFETGWKK